MKITKNRLRRIIREERALLSESWRLDEPKVDDWGPQQYSESDDSEYNRELRSVWLQDTGEKRHKEHVAAGDLASVDAYFKMQIQSIDGAGLKPEELEQLKSLQAHPKTSSVDIPFIMPAIIDRLPDFHDPASQEKFRSMSGTAKPAAKAAASSSPVNRGKRHSYDARVLEPMDAGMNTNADAVDGVLADLQRVGANDLADEVDMMIQMGDDDISGVLAMIPQNIKDKLGEGRQIKITKNQLRRIIKEEKAKLLKEQRATAMGHTAKGDELFDARDNLLGLIEMLNPDEAGFFIEDLVQELQMLQKQM